MEGRSESNGAGECGLRLGREMAVWPFKRETEALGSPRPFMKMPPRLFSGQDAPPQLPRARIKFRVSEVGCNTTQSQFTKLETWSGNYKHTENKIKK